MDVMEVIETAIGGLDVDTTIEGRERYRINVRYPRELRGSPEDLARVLVPIPFQQARGPTAGSDGAGAMAAGSDAEPTAMAAGAGPGMEGRVAHVRLGQLGRIHATMGPPMLKDEAGFLTGWVYVDTDRSDLGGYVADAKRAVAEQLELPAGYSLRW